jgi:hypothetical protein
VLRAVRDPLGRPGCRTRQLTLVPTRRDAAVYRLADLAALSRQRWQVETTLRRAVLPCQTVPGVLMELTIVAMVYNLVRLVMWHAARLPHSAVERISVLDALPWVSAPPTGMPLVALLVTPARPLRVEPRVKKRRPKRFPWMIKPRHALRQQLVQQEFGG